MLTVLSGAWAFESCQVGISREIYFHGTSARACLGAHASSQTAFGPTPVRFRIGCSVRHIALDCARPPSARRQSAQTHDFEGIIPLPRTNLVIPDAILVNDSNRLTAYCQDGKTKHESRSIRE